VWVRDAVTVFQKREGTVKLLFRNGRQNFYYRLLSVSRVRDLLKDLCSPKAKVHFTFHAESGRIARNKLANRSLLVVLAVTSLGYSRFEADSSCFRTSTNENYFLLRILENVVFATHTHTHTHTHTVALGIEADQ
jgi:hypothetical protein